jgi:2-polyprenyl-6-methoxyphenol hydroxylase-like FAD-dependent oxidoreductase
MALSLNKCGFDNVNIRKSKLKSYGRYYSINFFSKKYLEYLNIWENLEQNTIVPYKKIEIYKKGSKTLSFDAKDININHLGYIINEDDLVKATTKKILSNKNLCYILNDSIN